MVIITIMIIMQEVCTACQTCVGTIYVLTSDLNRKLEEAKVDNHHDKATRKVIASIISAYAIDLCHSVNVFVQQNDI